VKRYFAKLLLLAISSGLTLALIEFMVRLTGVAYEPQYDDRVRITRPAANPAIRYELIPRFRGRALGGEVTVNSFGLRGREVSLAAPDGTTRIAVLGDSWAFGWGVDQDEVVTSQLQQMLERSAGDAAFEVLNFAVYGYNLQQQEAVLVDKAIAFDPDLVILAFNINDLEGLALAGASAGDVQNRSAELDLFTALRAAEEFGNQHSHLIRLADSSLRGLALRLRLGSSAKTRYFARFYRDGSPELEFLEGAFDRIARAAREFGFAVCVVYVPWMTELSEGNPYRECFAKVRTLAEARGFSTLDLFPYYQGRDPSELRISVIDGHPTALGHRIAADAIAGFVLNRVWERELRRPDGLARGRESVHP
jgi:lysophospholipase L1-like esterase